MNIFAEDIKEKIEEKLGKVVKLAKSLSLYKISSNNSLIYFRYSKLFQSKNKKYQTAFYGLRKIDLDKLERNPNSFICFLWDNHAQNILLPYKEFKVFFEQYPPMSDGQYKIILFFRNTGTELYISKIGKFNVDIYYGIDSLMNLNKPNIIIPKLNHTQMQSIIASIGIRNGFDIWIPLIDRDKLDYTIIDKNRLRDNLPKVSRNVDRIIKEVDVIWIDKSSNFVKFFEVEHSTPIYSGLLRLNDVNLKLSNIEEMGIIADSERKDKFVLEISRPTFEYFKLIEKVSFMEYSDLYIMLKNM